MVVAAAPTPPSLSRSTQTQHNPNNKKHNESYVSAMGYAFGAYMQLEFGGRSAACASGLSPEVVGALPAFLPNTTALQAPYVQGVLRSPGADCMLDLDNVVAFFGVALFLFFLFVCSVCSCAPLAVFIPCRRCLLPLPDQPAQKNHQKHNTPQGDDARVGGGRHPRRLPGRRAPAHARRPARAQPQGAALKKKGRAERGRSARGFVCAVRCHNFHWRAAAVNTSIVTTLPSRRLVHMVAAVIGRPPRARWRHPLVFSSGRAAANWTANRRARDGLSSPQRWQHAPFLQRTRCRR